MDEVKEDLRSVWESAIDKLLEMPEGKRKHFAMLIVALAKCYTKEETEKAVVLIDNEDSLAFFSVGADEYDAFKIIERAHKLMADVHTLDAPEKGLYS